MLYQQTVIGKKLYSKCGCQWKKLFIAYLFHMSIISSVVIAVFSLEQGQLLQSLRRTPQLYHVTSPLPAPGVV